MAGGGGGENVRLRAQEVKQRATKPERKFSLGVFTFMEIAGVSFPSLISNRRDGITQISYESSPPRIDERFSERGNQSLLFFFFAKPEFKSLSVFLFW